MPTVQLDTNAYYNRLSQLAAQRNQNRLLDEQRAQQVLENDRQNRLMGMSEAQAKMQRQRFDADMAAGDRAVASDERAARDQSVQRVGAISRKALTIHDPAQRKAFLQQVLPVYAQDFGLFGVDTTSADGMARMMATPDEEIAGNLQRLAALGQDDAAKTANVPSAIQTFEYMERLSPQARARMLEGMRAPQVREIGGVQTIVGPGGSMTPLGSLEGERDARRGLAGATQHGKDEASRNAAYIDAGLAAADATAITRRGLELLAEVKTGGLNAVMLKASNLFGVTGADEGELSANLGKAVLAQLRSTFGAQFTENEGARLASIEAGFGKSTEANRRLLEQAQKILDRAARRGLAAAESSGDTFAADEIRKSLGFSLSAQPEKRGAGGLPPTNARGWKLMRDAQGNQAYVSPNGRQFEEVR
ncbi:MAG: hypothetical protein IT480_06465 [Gammaproteobacteria bacterium]|nr:hypothetical protein [Gammaproteobacteria bacterium]